ncbi:alpha/beta fold hydrolase [Burkholderia cepacia]|uniref:thioesterase domain-containing protein n=1 Tax=Burkholderia cepacia TaxID=292 RepID=UPI001588C56B|nr:alpha/beta fold hydrolase [Burkholderia cepacia]
MTTDQLVTLNRSCRQTVIYTFHAISGGVTAYSTLAGTIEDVASVKGIVSPGRVSCGRALDNIKDMAATAAAIIADDSRGKPYALLGWCMGGLIAYEAAILTQNSDRRPAFVALIDTNLVLQPEPSRATELERIYWTSLGQILAGQAWKNTSLTETLSFSTDSERFDYIFSLSKSRSSPPDLESMKRLVDVFEAHWRSTQRYKPTLSSVGFTFFSAADSPYPRAAQTWSELCGDLVTIERLSGNHFSVLERPHLDELSAWIRRSIQ